MGIMQSDPFSKFKKIGQAKWLIKAVYKYLVLPDRFGIFIRDKGLKDRTFHGGGQVLLGLGVFVFSDIFPEIYHFM